ncbi:hypothetical protein F4X10_08915 [Candidatus Poribacteria bacterium]|nr:hypothetical protein [Candidatus Poribacteria bacterium]
MKKLFRGFILSLAGVLTVSMLTGCGDIDDTDEPVPVNFVSATPTGGEINPNEWITITFDNPPTDVTVSTGTVTVAGKTATITGPFTPGPLSVTLTWADGTYFLNFIVHSPCCEPPTVTGGTVKDGDTDVDPELINSDRKIVIQFSEEVTGNIALQTESGDNVGWLGKVAGSKGTLELVKGRELVNETVYIIAGKISDAKGNASDFKITFVTKGKA